VIRWTDCLFAIGGLFNRRVYEVRKIASILVALALALVLSMALPVSIYAGAPLANVTNTPADTTAGATTTDNVTFTTAATLSGIAPVGQIIITFPAGFDASAASLNAAATLTPSGSPLTLASRTARVVTCNVTADEIAGTFNIVLDNIDNPQTADTYTVVVQTQNGEGVVLQSGLSAPFDITVGAVNTLTVLVEPSDTAAHAIITPPPEVKATDAFNNPIAGQDIAVALLVGSGTLSGTSPQSANASGIATFDDLSIDTRGPWKQLRFTADGVTIDSNLFNIIAGPATQLVITQQPGGSTSGVALTTQPIVEAQDQYGNINTSYTANVTAATNDVGTLTGTLSVAPVAGTATFTDLVYTATADNEIFQIDFTSGALTGTTSNDVSCDVTGTKLVFIQQPAGSVSGFALATQPIVAAQDANNVTDTDYVWNIVAGAIGPGTLTGTLAVTPVAGVATFTNLVYTATADNEIFQIYFTPPGLTGATSNDVICTFPRGGGGGALTASGSGSMNLAPYLNSEGRSAANINLNSTNGLVTVGISAGTLALDAQGNPLGNIQIVTLSTPPPPPGYVLVGHAYDCLPDGATFQPAITLTFKYTEADIPDGVNEQDLVLAYWDGEQWLNLATTVNIVNNTATAKVAHFTPFAILAYTGAPDLATSDLSGTSVVKEAAPPEGEGAKPLNPWVVAGIIAAVIVAVLIAVMLGRRRA
jgi:hypothetical protein